MEQVTSFLLENYGAFGVILLAIGGMAWIIIKELRHSNESLITAQQNMNEKFANSFSSSITSLSDKLTEDMREQNKALIKYVMQQQNIEMDKEHQKNLISRRNITYEINTIINNLRIELEADRVIVLEFHNSFVNTTGFPFLKYTVTYEKISKGSKTIQQNYQSSQFSSVATIAENVLNDRQHIFTLNNIEEIERICPIMMNDSTINRGVVFKGLFDNQNNILIGLIGIEFKGAMPDDYDRTPIIAAARTIGELLTLSKD